MYECLALMFGCRECSFNLLAKTSHLPSWCIVSLLMSKFVHCIYGHTFWITPLHLFVMWFDLFLPVFSLLFCSFHIAQLSGLWTWDQVRQNWKGPFPIMPSFIYSSIWTNPHPNPSGYLSESLTWFIVDYLVMLKATLECTQHSCLKYT